MIISFRSSPVVALVSVAFLGGFLGSQCCSAVEVSGPPPTSTEVLSEILTTLDLTVESNMVYCTSANWDEAIDYLYSIIGTAQGDIITIFQQVSYIAENFDGPPLHPNYPVEWNGDNYYNINDLFREIASDIANTLDGLDSSWSAIDDLDAMMIRGDIITAYTLSVNPSSNVNTHNYSEILAQILAAIRYLDSDNDNELLAQILTVSTNIASSVSSLDTRNATWWVWWNNLVQGLSVAASGGVTATDLRTTGAKLGYDIAVISNYLAQVQHYDSVGPDGLQSGHNMALILDALSRVLSKRDADGDDDNLWHIVEDARSMIHGRPYGVTNYLATSLFVRPSEIFAISNDYSNPLYAEVFGTVNVTNDADHALYVHLNDGDSITVIRTDEQIEDETEKEQEVEQEVTQSVVDEEVEKQEDQGAITAGSSTAPVSGTADPTFFWTALGHVFQALQSTLPSKIIIYEGGGTIIEDRIEWVEEEYEDFCDALNLVFKVIWILLLVRIVGKVVRFYTLMITSFARLAYGVAQGNVDEWSKAWSSFVNRWGDLLSGVFGNES